MRKRNLKEMEARTFRMRNVLKQWEMKGQQSNIPSVFFPRNSFSNAVISVLLFSLEALKNVLSFAQ